MRYAVIADIHANLEALVSALRLAESLDAERIICLGDIVGYHANPNECVDLVRRHAAVCVRGNHDSVAAGMREPDEFSPRARHAVLWTAKTLTPENRQYLQTRPLLQAVDDCFLAVHAALHPEPNDHRRIRSIDDALPSLELLARRYAGCRVCFFGHMHVPAVYALRDMELVDLGGTDRQLDGHDAYMVNPGSVGQSRNADPRGSLILYDSVRQRLEYHAFSYDFAAARDKAIACGLIPRAPAIRRALSWMKRQLLPPERPHLSHPSTAG